MEADNLIALKQCDAERGVHVVFVHGLDGDWKSTWASPDLKNKQGWMHWLAEEFQREILGVWSYDYAAFSTGWRGEVLPLFDRGARLLELVSLDINKPKAMVFVCHSLGGLVVKSMLERASTSSEEAKRDLLSVTRAVIFLGTPHNGSGVAKIVNHLLPGLVKQVFRKTVLVDELDPTNLELVRLRESFVSLAGELGWFVKQYAEKRKTHGIMIVDRHSANSGVGGCVPVEADHIQLPKIAAKSSSIYKQTLKIIREQLGAESLGVRRQQKDVQATVGELDSASNGDNSVYYQKIQKVICKLMAEDLELADFLGGANVKIFSMRDGRWDLGPGVKISGGQIVRLLDNAVKALETTHNYCPFLNDLEIVISGLIVMAVDGRWAAGQCAEAEMGVALYPGEGPFKIEADDQVLFLKVYLAAFMDVCFPLDDLMMTTLYQDHYHVPPGPKISRGIGQIEEMKSLKRHLVAHRTKRVPVDGELDRRFEQLLESMADDRREKEKVYYATDNYFNDLKEYLKGDVLQLYDLFLMFPRGGDEEEVVEQAHLLVPRIVNFKKAVEMHKERYV